MFPLGVIEVEGGDYCVRCPDQSNTISILGRFAFVPRVKDAKNGNMFEGGHDENVKNGQELSAALAST